ncbi:uncharacterized protein LOC129600361 [Paramacrobiotus metropolitanus]|uniref:uncharacterized protein LOC129600361 n=1 Tax=Paramacrobiotus metropolitanus TaxID=2943436 RepID=UPI0024459C22|nr:uncharacterized protein LOC129600361 [Paramacrobiotus metropolitanus]
MEVETATNERPRWRQFLWRCLDGFICIFILAPLVVLYWRGSFQLLDYYVYPRYPHPYYPVVPDSTGLKISGAITLVIGICGTIVANVLQTILHQRIHEKRRGVLQLFLKRIYTYTFGWIIVCHWRGVFRVWDGFTGTDVFSGIYCFSSGVILLILLKSFRNVVAPPLVTVSDFDKNYFFIKTRFRRKPWGAAYFLDTIFSIVVPGSLVAFVWRGQWSILDHVFKRDSMVESFVISAALGFGIVVMLFALQDQAGKVSAAMERRGWTWAKIAFEDLFFYIAALGAVNIWRSIWGLCDELLLKGQWALSNWVCHIVGGFGTMLLLHGNSVLVRDVQIDGEYPNGEGCRFFSKSLTFFENRADKQKRKQQQTNGIPAEIPDISTAAVDEKPVKIYRKLPAAKPADVGVQSDQLEHLLSGNRVRDIPTIEITQYEDRRPSIRRLSV